MKKEKNMSGVTELMAYKHRADLELCLMLIENVYIDLRKGDCEFAKVQLADILDTFDRGEPALEKGLCVDNILYFPQCRQK